MLNTLTINVTKATYANLYGFSARTYTGTGKKATGSTCNLVDDLAAEPPVLFIKNVDYNAVGQTTKIEYGNNTVITYTYDNLTKRLTRIRTVNGSNQVLQDLSYTYDSAGQIATITDAVNSASQAFTYDHLNRLLTASNSRYGNQTFAYDEIGNIISKDGLTYTYGSSKPHAVTSLNNGSTFTYDANGNMSRRVAGGATTDYTYDVENRLTNIKVNNGNVADYSYDGDGGRTKKFVYGTGGGTTSFVGSLYEVGPSGPTRHAFMGSTRIASTTNGNPVLLFGDHLGSANVITDKNGVAKEINEYQPFGGFSRHERIGVTSDQTQNYFTGQRLDPEGGLYYYGARYYDPLIGRFITPDSIIQAPYNSQSLNRYSYCLNNPVNLIDPTGHSWNKFWKQAVAVTVGVVAFVASGFNPVVGFQAYGLTSSALTLGSAIASGQGVGRALGSFAASFAISVAGGYLGVPYITDPFLRTTAFAAQGAITGATTSAISGGDIGQGALMGGVLGGAMGFMSSEQFQNWRTGDGFTSNELVATRNHRIANMADALGYEKNGTVAVGKHGQHVGLDIDGSTTDRIIGKYPLASQDARGSTRNAQYIFGKRIAGEYSNSMETSSQLTHQTLKIYAINGVQEAMLNNYINNGPGSFALTTNCTDWAVGALRSIGQYVPRGDYSTLGFSDPNKLFR